MHSPQKNSCLQIANLAKDTHQVAFVLDNFLSLLPTLITMNHFNTEPRDLCKRCFHNIVDVDMSCGCHYHVVSSFKTDGYLSNYNLFVLEYISVLTSTVNLS